MVKKILTSLLIILLLASIILGYLYLKTQKDYKGTNPLQAVPINAQLILQTPNASHLLSQLKKPQCIWTKMAPLPCINKINKDLSGLDSLLNTIPKGNNISLNRPLLLASSLTGKNQIDYLFVMPINDFLEEKRIKTFIQKSILPPAQILEREYNRTTLYQIHDKSRNGSILNYAFSKGLVLLSRSQLLLEDAVRQLSTNNSISKTKGFAQIQRTIGKNAEANIYLNLKTFPKQISFLLDQKFSNYIRNYTHLANWTELDLSLKEKTILLNGFTYSDTQKANYLNLFQGQEPVKMEICSILPANTNMLAEIGLDNPLLFKNKHLNYLEQIGKLQQHNAAIKKMKLQTGENVEEILYSLLYKEMALAFTGNKKEDQFAVIRTRSSSIARDKMLKILKGYARRKNKPLSYYTAHYQLDSQTRFDIYKLPYPQLLQNIFGNLFAQTPSNYFAFINNHMVMGASVRAISQFIHDSALGKTLISKNKYKRNKEYLFNKANFYFYTTLTSSLPVIAKYANNKLKSQIEKQKQQLQKIQSIGVQLSTNNKLIYNNIFIKYDSILNIPPQTQWESRIDTCFHHKPFMVRNHYTKDKEIFIQDDKNQIYLINSSGRILWKKQIKESIIGQMHQIDFYGNNKLQYLFATTTHIQLIDRNGNNVENYPIKLKAKTSKGISLFDYNRNLNYRIFIPCEDQKIYAYTKDGKLIPGWKFNKTENTITSQVQHFRVSGKDYLVFADQFRVYILNRKGQERVKLKQQFSKSPLNKFYLDNTPGHAPRIVTTDISGTLYYCYFSGAVEKTTLKNVSKDHYFLTRDLNGDRHPEYLLADNDKLMIFSNGGKSLMTKKFECPISYMPSIYSFSRRNKEIGICLGQNNKILLLNTKGEIHKGFPLHGTTPFTISADPPGTFQLLVGDARNFLLNYSVK